MIRIRRPFALLVPFAAAVAALAAGCGPDSTPEGTAGAFWRAIADGDRGEAARYVTDASLRWVDEGSIPRPTGEVRFEEPLRNDSAAIVPTRLTAESEDTELELVFDTHLVHGEDGWKVDLVATRPEIARAVFNAGLQQIGDAIGQGFSDLGEALERGVGEAREALDEALRDLGDRRAAPPPPP